VVVGGAWVAIEAAVVAGEAVVAGVAVVADGVELGIGGGLRVCRDNTAHQHFCCLRPILKR